MNFPSLGLLDFTDNQVLGFKYQFAEDTQSPAKSLDEYMGIIFLAVADSYAARHVDTKIKTTVETAFEKATDKQKADVAAILNVDIVVPPPAVKP